MFSRHVLRVLALASRGSVTGLEQLHAAGGGAERADRLFRAKATWLVGRRSRLGDMRRLIHQHGRTPEFVFPIDAWHEGGTGPADVNIPVPRAGQAHPSLPAGQELH